MEDKFTLTFRALSDPVRLRIICLLLKAPGAVCVCELADALEIPQYRVSRHLAVLKSAELVWDSRVGTWAYYSIAEQPSEFAAEIYGLISEHISGPVYHTDLRRLESRLSLREDGMCVIGPGSEPARS
jgi:ArsR family transcriptional regulator